jgi:hypothetical protein
MPDRPFTEQPVATARLCLQQIPIRSKRLANCRCVDVKRAFHNNGAGPDAIHQLIFGDKLPRRPDQDFDDFEGSRADGYRRTKDPEFAASKIDLALARRVDIASAINWHDQLFLYPIVQLFQELRIRLIAVNPACRTRQRIADRHYAAKPQMIWWGSRF